MVRVFAKPSSSHTSTHSGQVPKLCSFLYDSLNSGALQLVADAGVRPWLFYYNCDGTPIRTHLNATAHVVCLTIRREGKQTKEYIAQVCFLRFADSATRTSSKCIFTPPLPLAEGKSAAAQFKKFQAGLQVGVNLQQRVYIVCRRATILFRSCDGVCHVEDVPAASFLKVPLYGEITAESNWLETQSGWSHAAAESTLRTTA